MPLLSTIVPHMLLPRLPFPYAEGALQSAFKTTQMCNVIVALLRLHFHPPWLERIADLEWHQNSRRRHIFQ